MQNYLGEIRMFGGTFAPLNWALCDGRLLAISQYDALYSLIGTTYGGDGQVTFGLPDLRGRIPVGEGQGPGLSSYTIGQMSGTEEVTLVTAQLPQHTHVPMVSGDTGSVATPGPTVVPAVPGGTTSALYATAVPPNPPPNPVAMSSQAIAPDGNSLPHGNMMPTTCVSFIIALYGIYPSRN